MYNYHYKIKYNLVVESDSQYKKDILECFFLTNNDFDKIIVTQEKLFQQYQNNKSFMLLLNFVKNNQKVIPCDLPIQTCLVLCFSFDYFYLFHKCLQDLNKKNKISETNFNNIINSIKKNS